MLRQTRPIRLRTNKGSLLALAILFLALIVLPAAVLLFKQSLLLTKRSEYQRHLEAASLLAAERLSRVVVNDPHFGEIVSADPPRLVQLAAKFTF